MNRWNRRLRRALALPLSRLPIPIVNHLGNGRGASALRFAMFRALSIWPRNFLVQTKWDFSYQGNTRDIIQRAIFVYGVWEPSLSTLASQTIRRGDVVVDVGANTGYFSLLFSRLTGPSGRVISIEPVPTIRRQFERNIELNKLRNLIDVIPSALGAESGLVEVFRASDENIGNSATKPEIGSSSEGLVPKVTAAELLMPFSHRIRLIKIDTEGDEAAVLGGMVDLLPVLQAGAVVIVEVSPDKLALRGKSAEDVLRFFPIDTWQRYRVDNDYDFRNYHMRNDGSLTELRSTPQSLADLAFVKI